MHAGPRGSAHGNWIWLPTAAFSAAIIAAVVISYGGGPGCKARAAASTPTPAPADASAEPATPPSPSPTATAGMALYYDPGSAVGSCAMGPFPATGLYVSLPPPQYADGAACGTYMEVRGPGGTVRAEVVDLCPACAATTINLSRAAFDRIANPTPGSARVAYWRAIDPPLHHRLRVGVLSGPGDGGIAIQILHHGNPLTSVAIARAPGSAGGAGADLAGTSAAAKWQALTLQPNGLWASTRPVGSGPFDLRLADAYGHQVTLTDLALAPGAVIWSRQWMYRLTAKAATPAPKPTPSRAATAARPAVAGGCPSK